MADFIRFLSSMREQMNAELTRSDVLRPLVWPIGGLLLALSTALAANARDVVVDRLMIAAGAFMVLYALAYSFFALTDRDALRSEKYKLQKLAIEHGLYGDSRSGLIDVSEPIKLVSAAEPKSDEAE